MVNILEKEIKKFIEEIRPTVEIRDKLDIGYTFIDNSLEIFEVRPQWDNPKTIIHSPIAKTKFIKSKNIWKVYWMRASGKWVLYDPTPVVKTLSEFFIVLKKDKYGAFWG